MVRPPKFLSTPLRRHCAVAVVDTSAAPPPHSSGGDRRPCWRTFGNDETQMDTTVSLADLRDLGISIQPHEAIAIAQLLINEPPGTVTGEVEHASPGPLSIHRVHLARDGSVVCGGWDATPAVSEMAILLQTVLPLGGPGMPGGLRYAIARALLDVEAPPFDSLEEFSQALARFERGDRREAIRQLFERALSARRMPRGAASAAELAQLDRRRPGVSVTDLRRDLREADLRLYELQFAAAGRRRDDGPDARPGPRFPVTMAAVVGGLSLLGAAEAVHLRMAQHPKSTPSPITRQISNSETPTPVESVQSTAAEVKDPSTSTPILTRNRRTHLRHVVSSKASAQRVSATRSRQRDKSESSGIFPHIRFKWSNDVF